MALRRRKPPEQWTGRDTLAVARFVRDLSQELQELSAEYLAEALETGATWTEVVAMMGMSMDRPPQARPDVP